MVFRDIMSANNATHSATNSTSSNNSANGGGGGGSGGSGGGSSGGSGGGGAVTRDLLNSPPVGFIRVNLDPQHSIITAAEAGFQGLENEQELLDAHCVGLSMTGLQALRGLEERVNNRIAISEIDSLSESLKSTLIDPST
jgi:hypothetical protein